MLQHQVLSQCYFGRISLAGIYLSRAHGSLPDAFFPLTQSRIVVPAKNSDVTFFYLKHIFQTTSSIPPSETDKQTDTISRRSSISKGRVIPGSSFSARIRSLESVKLSHWSYHSFFKHQILFPYNNIILKYNGSSSIIS